MTIKSIEAIPLSMPFDMGAPKPMLAGKPREMEMLLVRVETTDGVVGWGEAFGFAIWPATKLVIETLIAPHCIGRQAADYDEIHAQLSRTLHLLGRSGPVMYGLSGVNIALWDIAAKVAGKPLYELLGGKRRDHVEAYASLIRYGDAHHVAVNARRAVADGFKSIKLHEIVPATIASARDAIGPDIGLMVDANCPWSTEQAIFIAQQIEHLDIHWLEEPIWPPEDYRAMAELRQRSGMRIAAGENAQSHYDFESMIAHGAVDYIQPSVTKIGGISEMLRIAQTARRHGVQVAPHSPYVGPGLLATLHILASWEEAVPVEHCYCDLEANPVGGAINVSNGRMEIPTGIGLGIDPDESIVERYAIFKS